MRCSSQRLRRRGRRHAAAGRAALAEHNDVIVMLVLDPSSKDLPERGRAVVSGGELQLQVDAGPAAGARGAAGRGERAHQAHPGLDAGARRSRAAPLHGRGRGRADAPACSAPVFRGGSDDVQPETPAPAPGPAPRRSRRSRACSDIVMPAPVPAAAARAGLVLWSALVCWPLAFWGYRRHQRARAANRYRREALAELEAHRRGARAAGRPPPARGAAAAAAQARRAPRRAARGGGRPHGTRVARRARPPLPRPRIHARVRAGSSRSSPTGRGRVLSSIPRADIDALVRLSRDWHRSATTPPRARPAPRRRRAERRPHEPASRARRERAVVAGRRLDAGARCAVGAGPARRPRARIPAAAALQGASARAARALLRAGRPRASGRKPEPGAVVLSKALLQWLLAPVVFVLLVGAAARPELVLPPLQKTESARDLLLAVDISELDEDARLRRPAGQADPAARRGEARARATSSRAARATASASSSSATAPHLQAPFTLDHEL